MKSIMKEIERRRNEMDDPLGYNKSEHSDNEDYRNGYKIKRVNSSYASTLFCLLH